MGLTWIKSSGCESASCAEVTRMGALMVLRSSLNPDVTAQFTAYQWGDFLREVTGEFVPSLVEVDADGGAVVWPPLRTRDSVPVRFTRDEWVAFQFGARDGEFAVGRVSA